jgi:hypothetical protein
MTIDVDRVKGRRMTRRHLTNSGRRRWSVLSRRCRQPRRRRERGWGWGTASALHLSPPCPFSLRTPDQGRGDPTSSESCDLDCPGTVNTPDGRHFWRCAALGVLFVGSRLRQLQKIHPGIHSDTMQKAQVAVVDVTGGRRGQVAPSASFGCHQAGPVGHSGVTSTSPRCLSIIGSPDSCQRANGGLASPPAGHIRQVPASTTAILTTTRPTGSPVSVVIGRRSPLSGSPATGQMAAARSADSRFTAGRQ